MSRNPHPLPDPIPSLGEFEGIINAKRKKDFGYGALTVGRNVEVTDTKKLVRRNGYAYMAGPGTPDRDAGPGFTGLYGSINQKQLLAVHEGALVLVDAQGRESALHSGLVGANFSWDEDPANNVYYTSDGGDSGVVLGENIWLPLHLVEPVLRAVAVIETAPWQVRPLNLGKRYTKNALQLFATYVYPDGRESAPSAIVTVPVAPEVKLLRVDIQALAGCTTLVYATTPGGSTYYLVASSTTAVFTFPVYMLTQHYAGPEYPYDTLLASFPLEATLVAMYAGRLFASLYDSNSKLGVVYASMPLEYHLFDQIADMFQVSGAPRLLLAFKDGLVIGTDDTIYIYQAPDEGRVKDGKLDTVANYGVPLGKCGAVAMDGTAWFWTERGIAKAAPYTLVTEHRFYGDPGVFNTAEIVYDRGYGKLVASTIAGAPIFNAWKERKQQ